MLFKSHASENVLSVIVVLTHHVKSEYVLNESMLVLVELADVKDSFK